MRLDYDDYVIEQIKILESWLIESPDNAEKVRSIIRKALSKVRSEMQQAAKAAIPNDPRQAYKAVKMSVYKSILGGNVAILPRRKAGSPGQIPPQRQQYGRGGNRRKRSARTIQLMSYQGADRSFILRFMNAGTSERAIQFTTDERRQRINYGSRGGRKPDTSSINTGRRGKIAARPWFASKGQSAIEKIIPVISKMIREEIMKQ